MSPDMRVASSGPGPGHLPEARRAAEFEAVVTSSRRMRPPTPGLSGAERSADTDALRAPGRGRQNALSAFLA